MPSTNSWNSWNNPTERRGEGGGGLDNRELVTQQRRVMDQQDKALDILGESILRQREMAEAINIETEEQLGLLDEMNDHTDLTQRRVKRENQRIEKFEATSSTKAMWCVIFLLLAALIVVIVLANVLK